MKELRILFTSVGRRVELMQAYKKAAAELGAKVTVYGADITDTAPALFFCDRRIIVKRIKDPGYIPQLLDVCQRENIDALIPTIDTDLLILSENKERFAGIGTQVLIGDPDKIRLCRDKRLTADYFISCGLKSPVPVDDYMKYEGGYPAFIKPKDGSSSIDAYRVNSCEELKTYARRVEDYIIQPFIEGTEYTIDAFCDLNGEPVFITPRERTAVRSGEVLKTTICQDDVMIEECKKLLADFRPVGAITVQLIKQKSTGDNYYIEINPRYGGGAPLSIKAGADSAKVCIRMLMGEKVSYTHKAAKDKAIYSRFDQSVCVNEKNGLITINDIIDVKKHLDGIKAVIFDLDDTLYPEKDYVKSGYRAVARYLGSEVYAGKLWEYFNDGKPAIDELLSELGKLDKKAECLEVYREHEPEIRLYDGVAEMIDELKESGCKLGIITDGRPSGQRKKLRALGLDKMIEEIIITDELGGEQFRKPCDIAFRIMHKRLGTDLCEMAYVGDNMAKDIQAPLSLSMRAVIFKSSQGLYQ
ncbi:MAG: ATP-grasp domain-containing protein [Ruminococcus sp.]|nr:ATP-grasp domain-containing protein [Ruminococcus sp.]